MKIHISLLLILISFSLKAQNIPTLTQAIVSTQDISNTSQNVVAQTPLVENIKAKLDVMSDGMLTVKEGDSFVATLTVWPIRNLEEGEFQKKYLNETFLGNFYVSKVFEEGYSVYNPEAYSVKMRLILTRHFEVRNFILWNYRSLNIPVSLTNINTIPLDGRNKELVLMTQKYKLAEDSGITIYVIIAALLILVIFLIYKHLVYRALKNNEKAYKDKWFNTFKNAQNREDYESIYAQRIQWEKCLEVKTPEIIEFYETINEHQYKRDWSEQENIEVAESFEQIRRILK